MEGALKYDRQIGLDDDSSVARLLEWVRPDSRILEIGPATGMMTRLMAELHRASITAVEIDSAAAEQARPWCEKIIVGSIEDTNVHDQLRSERFDTIVCADVLEHLVDPWAVLSFLKSLLAQDGEVLISIPNVGHTGVLAELFAGMFRYRRDGLLDETHLRFFTRHSVEDLLSRCKLEPLLWARTVRAPLATEFRPEVQGLSSGIRSLLQSLPDSDTYQFLVRARPIDLPKAAATPRNVFVPETDASSISTSFSTSTHKTSRLSQCFFDTGQGFSESQSCLSIVQQTHIHTRVSFEIPSKTKAIRIDPLDSQDWFRIEEIRVQNNQGVQIWSWQDGPTPLRSVAFLENLQDLALETGTIFLPTSFDPQITFSLPCEMPEAGSVSLILAVAPRISLSELWEQRNLHIADLSKELQSIRPAYNALRERLALLQSEVTLTTNRVENLSQEREVLTQQIHQLYSSRSWKLTSGLRAAVELARWGKCEARLAKRKLREVLKQLVRRVRSPGVREHPPSLVESGSPYYSPDKRYAQWRKEHEPSLLELEAQRAQVAHFSSAPVISVVLPVYRPKVAWLREAIESVRAQTYPYWELCIADDASGHAGISALLEAYAKEDPRIKVVFREVNGHIAESSNSALALATGEFIALLDHDDVLAPWAFHRVVQELNEHADSDYLYSDEDKLNSHGERVEPAFKPEWSPEYLLSFMYVGHLSVYRRDLVNAVGGFIKGTEGSQDYDLCLRVTEKTSKIRHIPQILYHWRMHEDSVALNIDAKPYAFKAGKAALTRACARRGLPEARIENTARGGIYSPHFRPTLQTEIPVLWVGQVAGSPTLPDSAAAIPLRIINASELAALSPDATVLVLDERVPLLKESDIQRLSEFLQIKNVQAAQGLLVRDGKIISAGYVIEGARSAARLAGESIRSPGPGARLVAMSNTRGVVWSALVVRASALRHALESTQPDLAAGSLRDTIWSLAVNSHCGGYFVTVPDVHLTVSSIGGKQLTGTDVSKHPSHSVEIDPYYPRHLNTNRLDFSFGSA